MERHSATSPGVRSGQAATVTKIWSSGEVNSSKPSRGKKRRNRAAVSTAPAKEVQSRPGSCKGSFTGSSIRELFSFACSSERCARGRQGFSPANERVWGLPYRLSPVLRGEIRDQAAARPAQGTRSEEVALIEGSSSPLGRARLTLNLSRGWRVGGRFAQAHPCRPFDPAVSGSLFSRQRRIESDQRTGATSVPDVLGIQIFRSRGFGLLPGMTATQD